MTTKSIGALALSALAFSACNKSFSWSPGSTTPSSSSSSSGPSSSSSSSPSSGGGSTTSTNSNAPFAATATSGPETWKRYDVRGIELGMARTALVAKGFTCGKRANSRCYKLMDKRCEQGHCELREDAFGQWFELNGAKTELDYMSCATTETDAALIYEIRLVFGPRQLLSPDSTLGKALIAKYGGATHVDEAQKEDKVGGGRMLWWNETAGSNGPNISSRLQRHEHGRPDMHADRRRRWRALGGALEARSHRYEAQARQPTRDRPRSLRSQPCRIVFMPS